MFLKKTRNFFFSPLIKVGLFLLTFVLSLWVVLPLLVGVLQSLAGSFGYLPGGILVQSNFEGWIFWFSYFSNLKAFLNSFFVSISSAILTLSLSFVFLAFFHQKIKSNAFFNFFLFVCLSTPHIALVTGIINFYAMAGMLDRILCFFLACERPIIGLSERYPLVSIIFSFVLKEVPFITYVSLASASSLPIKKLTVLGSSLGYSRYQTYWKMVLPQLYKRIRLSLFIVLSYSFASVEVPLVFSDLDAQIASLIILDKFYSPAFLTDYALGFAGSVLLVLGCLGCFLIWILLEKICFKLLPYLILIGKRQKPFYSILLKGQFFIYLLLGWFLPYALVLLWSFSSGWYFPDILPNEFSLNNYHQAVFQNYNVWFLTVILGLSASFLGLIIALLANEVFANVKTVFKNLIIYIALAPIILPQISFLFGFQILLEHVMLSGSFLSLLWSHSLFCFSYAYCILQYQQQKTDIRYVYIGYSLGLSKLKTFFKIRVPLMFNTIKVTFAVCFSISVSLYLPTLFAGGGRYSTLMTESVAFINSFNSRLSSTYSVLLTLLPLLCFLVFNLMQKKYE